MKANKKMAAMLVFGCLIILLSGCATKKLEKIEFDGRTIFYNSKEYTVQPLLETKKSSLDEKIGVIEKNLIVYSLKGQSKDDWLAIKLEGMNTVYKESNAKNIDLTNFGPKKIEVINPIGMGTVATITNKEDIQILVDSIKSGNGVTLPTDIVDSKVLNLLSDEYEDFIFVLTYVTDSNGKKYVFDNLQEKVYEVNDILSKYVK